MNIEQHLRQAKQALQSSSDSAHLDAELLMMQVLGCNRAHLLAYPEQELDESQASTLEMLLQRRQAGEPIAYILGHKEFWSLDFIVTPATLIPRPETEHLIEWTLNHFANHTECDIADLGTGSGAIAIALAHERPTWHIDAIDQSSDALQIAKHNAQRLNTENISFHQGSWCAALPQGKKYHGVIANPPYVATNDPDLAQLQYEPQSALDGGIHGLDDIRKIIAEVSHFLHHNGYFILEHGNEQGAAVADLLSQAGFIDVELHHDLAKLPRYTTAQWPF